MENKPKTYDTFRNTPVSRNSSPAVTELAALVGCSLRPDHVSNAYVHGLVCGYSHLIGHEWLRHHGTIMAGV